MVRLVLACLALGVGFGVQAQNGLPPLAGARSAGLAYNRVLFQDINSTFGNQAGLAFLEGWGLTAQVEQRFIQSDIRSFAFGGAIPSALGTFAASVHYYGVELYNEQRFGLAYARQLFEGFSIGAQFDLISFRIPEYGNKLIPTFELGLQARILPELRMGFHLYNPIRTEVVQEELLPTLIAVAAAYEPSSKVSLMVEVEKDIDRPVRIKGGIEYYVLDILPIRLGGATQPASFTFGFGLHLNGGFRVHTASAWDPLLGFSPALSLDYTRVQPE